MHPPPSPLSQNPREPQAFTLAELLIVIAVILIVAGVMLPTMSFMRTRADSATCLSNLRQIGVGIGAYANDHDTFPGPLTVKQSATYDTTQPGSLAALLENYLGATTAGGTNHFCQAFLCPAAYRKSQSKTISTDFMNEFPIPGYNQSIWGNSDQGLQPLSKAALTNWYDVTLIINGTDPHPLNLSEMWAMQDADQDYILNHDHNFLVSDMSDLLPLPVHDNYYNALFFDMHVERRMVSSTDIGVPATPTPAP